MAWLKTLLKELLFNPTFSSGAAVLATHGPATSMCERARERISASRAPQSAACTQMSCSIMFPPLKNAFGPAATILPSLQLAVQRHCDDGNTPPPVLEINPELQDTSQNDVPTLTHHHRLTCAPPAARFPSASKRFHFTRSRGRPCTPRELG